MGLYVGDKPAVIYKGDARPVNLYRGAEKVAGWKWSEQSGVDMAFDATYNDRVDVVAMGRSKQTVTVQGKNLFDISRVAVGGLGGTGGREFVTLNRIRTVFIPARGDTHYSLTIPTGFSSANYHSYAVDKTWLGAAVKPTPPNTAYIRASFKKTDENDFTEADLTALKLLQWQIEEGASSTTYEPFVPDSPSPDYPSPIISANGDLVVEGRNVINVPDTSRGAAYSHAYQALASALNGLPRNTPFRAWYDLDTDGAPRAAAAQGGYVYVKYDDDSNQIMRYGDAFQLADKQVTSANIYGADSVGDHATYNRFYNFCVTRADQNPKLFTPYRPIITHALPELRGIPDGAGGWVARDALEVIGGRWRLTQRVEPLVLDGTESWGHSNLSYTSDLSLMAVTLSKYGYTGSIVLSTHYKYHPNQAKDACRLGNVGQMMYIFTPTVVSVEAYKIWLATQHAAGTPVTINYVLATPVVHDLGPIDLPSYYPATTQLLPVHPRAG